MARIYKAEEVALHTSPESCWVILYDHVYDVTDFLMSHPGGSKIILQLAGKDATEEYDPVHPPGTLEDNLKPEAKLGQVDAASLAEAKTVISPPPNQDEKSTMVNLETMLNLDDIEAAATARVSKKCWAYYWSAGDDLFSKAFNNSVYRSILLRPRVFRDCTTCDTRTAMCAVPSRIAAANKSIPNTSGFSVGTPLYISPAAMARLAHPDGEAGIAHAASFFGAAQIVSNNASMTPEQILADAKPGQVFGWQLYVQTDRSKSIAMLERVNKLKDWYKLIVLTLDAPVPGKREEDDRQGLVTSPPVNNKLTAMSSGKTSVSPPKGPTAGGGGVGRQLFWGTAADLTWISTLMWLKQHTDLPIVIKGAQTHEDVYLAAKYAQENPGHLRGVILSNHGGRALDTAPPAVHTLLEVRKYCPGAFDDIEIWVDGGIKRGTDVVKALCLGAKAVGIGRAALWGLGAGGWEGVHRTLEILQAEIVTCMKLLGAKTISDLGPQFINTRMVERDIYDGPSALDDAATGLWQKAKL